MFVGVFQNPYRRYGFSREIEFFEVVFRHHPAFFDETHRFASSEPVSRCLVVLKSIPAVWIFTKIEFFEVVFRHPKCFFR
ncbi:hypothetical protein PAPYR_11065 [Paratrimastix pyriformis]|uniref:Uncharacterized protein n=1 Tax=Paratrimastix pyriformis TaxID=342808 RepID=A0ABQ8U4M8_9EUKA|nr:hypothetical protein PAPYR_11065 [Paratrimastix pyriformis]